MGSAEGDPPPLLFPPAISYFYFLFTYSFSMIEFSIFLHDSTVAITMHISSLWNLLNPEQFYEQDETVWKKKQTKNEQLNLENINVVNVWNYWRFRTQKVRSCQGAIKVGCLGWTATACCHPAALKPLKLRQTGSETLVLFHRERCCWCKICARPRTQD